MWCNDCGTEQHSTSEQARGKYSTGHVSLLYAWRSKLTDVSVVMPRQNGSMLVRCAKRWGMDGMGEGGDDG
jgi:hypothetical protein